MIRLSPVARFTPHVLLLLAAGGLVGSWAAGADVLTGPEADQRLEQYLERLGLLELQAVHLEQLLDREPNAARQQPLVQRLADLYAAQLLTQAQDSARYEATMRQIEQLIAKAPAAKTPALEVMLLQADYSRAEQLVQQWLADRDNPTARGLAGESISKVALALNQVSQRLQQQHDQWSVELEGLPAGANRHALEQQFTRLQAVLGRASYFTAWAQYYAGLAQNNRGSFEQARALFRQILDLGDDYRGLDADSLGLTSIWRARSLVGLALAETALGADDKSRQAFTLLRDPSVPPEIRGQVGYWELQSFLNVERYADAEKLARKEIAALDGQATQAAVSLCTSLVRAGFGGGTASPERRSLGLLGLGGLVKLGQRRAALQLMTKHGVEFEDGTGFYLQWLRGQQHFEQAEQSKKPNDYAQAAQSLAAALATPEAAQDLGSSGQCRNQRAWCLYRLGQHESAGREFRLAAEELRAAHDARAVDAAWMAFVAFQSAAESQSPLKEQAIDALNWIKREFPRHEYARRADYHIGKLQHGESPEEALQVLAKTPPDAPTYLSARFEICQLLHRRWSQAPDGEKGALGAQVREAVDAYLAAARTDSDKARQARCSLWGAEVTLHAPETDLSQAARYVDRAKSLTAALPPTHPVVAEYHFRALELAQRQGDAAAERTHAEWLVQQAAGSAYELPALIVAARTVDQSLASGNATPTQLEEGHKLYRRLVELLGDTPESVQSNRNAQVASSKLAQYAEALGRHAEAAERLDRLLDAMPGAKNKSYLRRSALAHYRAGDHEAALAHWRTLLRGVTPESDDWFEAKFYQLSCLLQTNPDQGRVAFEQFKLLYPDLGPPAWRDKFAALNR